ncbi:Ig-like domain-containing protein [Enterococcus crotali]|uniref:Ig-like domain-containing protein n=1 Tax=Enterococcus crotali TaxID=1453587 RepID=UPI000AFF9694|nr:Ig-like domain-containing protein [Enterococcus crotali]
MKNWKLGLIGISLLGASLVNFAPEAHAVEIENRTIIGSDDRVQITDGTKAPYQSTTFIAVDGSTGSGAVIGKNTVLTAAHVVNKIRNNPTQDNVYVVPGRTGSTTPYGKFKIKEVFIPQSYLDAHNPDSDIAVITLEQNNGQSIGDLVAPMPFIETDTVGNDTKVTTSGYPGDKPWATLWEASGKVVGETKNRINFDMDVMGGQSGSPIYNDQQQIIGVVAYASTYYNFGTKMNSEYFDFVSQHLDSPIEAKDIQVDKQKVTLNIGESTDVKANVLPVNAANNKLHWDTTADQIATVDQNGKITATGPGVTIIDVSTDDGKITKYIEVTVTNIVKPKEIVVETESVELNAGDSFDLKASVLPENASNKQLNFETTDEGVATVDSNGRITGVNPGSTIIDVQTANGEITKYINVTVNEVAPKEIVVDKDNVELNLGNSLTLKASVLPANTTDKELFWISMDESIVDVDDNGKITGKKEGTTEILVLSVTNFGEIEKRITVTVKEKEQLQSVDLNFPAKKGLYFSKKDLTDTFEMKAIPDGTPHILFHLNKLNTMYDLKIGELDFVGGTGMYNIRPLTLGHPIIQTLYDVDVDRKLENSKIVIMYVDKKNPTIVKDYFIVEQR